jgi:hypothetical protein
VGVRELAAHQGDGWYSFSSVGRDRGYDLTQSDIDTWCFIYVSDSAFDSAPSEIYCEAAAVGVFLPELGNVVGCQYPVLRDQGAGAESDFAGILMVLFCASDILEVGISVGIGREQRGPDQTCGQEYG